MKPTAESGRVRTTLIVVFVLRRAFLLSFSSRSLCCRCVFLRSAFALDCSLTFSFSCDARADLLSAPERPEPRNGALSLLLFRAPSNAPFII